MIQCTQQQPLYRLIYGIVVDILFRVINTRVLDLEGCTTYLKNFQQIGQEEEIGSQLAEIFYSINL